jgi:SAM-dependent methyltransferase
LTTQAQIDEAKAGEFAGRFITAANGAAVMALTALGRHTGLFETMSGLPPSTSPQIGEAAGLDERYVREWLGGMVLARFVEYDSADGTYTLPPEHAAFLTRAAGPNDLSSLAMIFPYLGTVLDEVLESFRSGGGVPYSSFKDFQALQAEMTGPFFEANLIDVILPMAPGTVERLQAGGEALDIGCGAGKVTNLLAAAFPNSRFRGYDFSREGIEIALKEAAAKGLLNASFQVADIATAIEPARYDLITAMEVVHDLAQPERVLRAVYEGLKPGGVFLVVDIAASSNLEGNYDHPVGPMLFTFSVFHCMTVSLSQRGAGLGTVVGEQKVTDLLTGAGFQDVDVRHVEGDFFYAYYVARKG